MKLNIRSLIFLCALFAGVLCACNKDDVGEKLAEEEKKLAEYITTNFGDAAINLGDGVYMVKTHEDEEGATVEAGNYILWNQKITNHITEELEYTSDKSGNFPESYIDGGPELTVVLSRKIDEGLQQMRKGESADIYIPSRWLFVDFQPRVYSAEIVDVIKDLSKYQEGLMSSYIRRYWLPHRGVSVDTVPNVVSSIDKTEYNVMYHIVQKGTGEAITEGMNVDTKTSISYMIWENDVRTYLTDTNITWHTGADKNKINTLTETNCVGEILTKMKKGGRVVVTMTSKLYWEDKNLPVNGYNQYYIPKWSVVIFIINT